MSRARKLAAAAKGFGRETFTLPDLAVVAWMADKTAFGLKGFENLFPDSKIVAVELARRGPLKRSIERAGVGVYQYVGAP